MQNKGFSIIEALIGITIGGLLLMTFSTLIYQTIKINRINTNQIKATMYLQEMIEVAKDLEKETEWTELNKSCVAASPCHPEPSGTNWILNPGEELLEGNYYNRHLIISPVSRNAVTKMIESVYNPANDDPHTKKITATIIWENGARTSQLEAYAYKY